MLLNDIGKKPTATVKQINRYLKENFGIKISSQISDDELQRVFRQVHEEITQLKMQGNVAMSSPEISKRLLVLEGLRAIKENRLNTSPVYASVMRNLIDYVVDHVKLEVSGDEDFAPAFEEAVKNAMREYRSSRYRFPDEKIESNLRDEAKFVLKVAGITNGINATESGNDPWGAVGKRAGALGGHRAEVGPNVDRLIGSLANVGLMPMDGERTQAGSAQVDPRKLRTESSMHPDLRPTRVKNPRSGEVVEDPFNPVEEAEDAIVHNTKSGRKQRNPFADQERDIRGRGVNPREPIPPKPEAVPRGRDPTYSYQGKLQGVREAANLVKRLRCLLETEVSQAEVMMAAKGFAQELQEMVEKIGRLQNEDLPPVTDQMRQTYGTDSASAFQTQIYAALQGVMDALYTAKSQVDAAVDSMASTGQVGAQIGMDVDMSDELPPEDDLGLDGLGAGIDAELDGGGAGLDDLGGDEFGGEDEFGGAEEEDPLGRAQKESIKLYGKVVEMKKLINKARKLKEAKKTK